MRERTMAAITLLAAGALLAGCTGTSGVNTQDLTTATGSSTISASISSTVDPSSSAQTPSAASTPLTTDTAPSVSAGTEGLSAQEAADRAAIEAQWDEFWQVYLALPHTPAEDRQALAAAVAVDPASDQSFDGREHGRTEGLGFVRSDHPSDHVATSRQRTSDGGHCRLPGHQPSRIAGDKHRETR